MLLVGASLFVRSILNIYNADAGIDTTKLMTMRMFMPGDAYASPAAITARVDDVVRRVEALPGVTSAFASNLVPFSGGGGNERHRRRRHDGRGRQGTESEFLRHHGSRARDARSDIDRRARLHRRGSVHAFRRRPRQPGARRARLAGPFRHRRPPIPARRRSRPTSGTRSSAWSRISSHWSCATRALSNRWRSCRFRIRPCATPA